MKEIKKIVRFKNNVDKEILDFVNTQSNFSDAVTYLIEKEIHENGTRDLMKYVPSVRTEFYFNSVNKPKEIFNPVKEVKRETKIANKPILSSYQD